MPLTTIHHAVDDGILTVTLQRPEQLNAFTVEMADEWRPRSAASTPTTTCAP